MKKLKIYLMVILMLFSIIACLGSDKKVSKKVVPDNANYKTWTESTTGIEFVWVPAGCYQMGCGYWIVDCKEDGYPAHEVCLDGFWIGRYEITQKQWNDVMGSNPSHFKDCGDNCPVERVSWKDTKDFINKLKSMTGLEFRLPTEAEWEYAARSGGKKHVYAGGEDIEEFAWYSRNSEEHTQPVGTKKPNAFGIYDMSGNVYEWCEDVYDENSYMEHSGKNPLYIGDSDYRVMRGGSWFSYSGHCKTVGRSKGIAGQNFDYQGFRLVKAP